MTLMKLSRAPGRKAVATSLTGQSTSLDQSGEASRTVLLSDYPEAMHRAQQLLFEDTMGPTDDLLSKGHMSNLAVQTVDGINQAIHCMVG